MYQAVLNFLLFPLVAIRKSFESGLHPFEQFLFFLGAVSGVANLVIGGIILSQIPAHLTVPTICLFSLLYAMMGFGIWAVSRDVLKKPLW